jgi:ubiquitin-protein ligase E3 D
MAADSKLSVSATSPSPTRQPSIYAELLPRLGRISVVIHLPTPTTHKTKVLLARDGLHLIVHHEGASIELPLPGKTSVAGEHLPGEVKPGLVKMSWRLFPTPEEAQAALHVESGAVTWSAAHLRPGTCVACRECDEPIVSPTTIKAFKDLPSENWAEMMEFWHCHKPTNAHRGGANAAADAHNKASEHQLASRGYGANSTISAQNGVGFVDLLTILFSQTDCNCLLVSTLNKPERGSIQSRRFLYASSNRQGH